MKDVLSVVWAAGKLGAAFYCFETSEISILPDITESAPNFEMLNILFQQVDPGHLIVSARQDERFITAVKKLCGENDGNGDDDSSEFGSQDSSAGARLRHGLQRTDMNRSQDVNEGNASIADEEEKCELLLLPGKDFAPDPCKSRLQGQRLPEEEKTFSEAEHSVFITSLIPFSNDIMVRATGALLRFLDRNAIELFQIELIDGQVPVLDIRICHMDDLVMVDESAWDSLQIFRSDTHPAAAKQGAAWASSKEGLSVFSLLNKCSSAHGSRYLRHTLSRPTRNFGILGRRHDVVEFCVSPLRTDFVRNAKDSLKFIKSFPKLLYKLSILHASGKEWKELYQSIYHSMLLTETLAAQPNSIELFNEMCDPDKREVLKTLSQEINKVVDFEESLEKSRFVPKVGIDPLLDKKRQQFSCLPQIMTLVAKEEMDQLPQAVTRCSTIYIPEVGYLLAVNFWKEELSDEELNIAEMQLHFTSHNIAYYKSVRAQELDKILGDCQVDIMNMETAVMIQLSQMILKHKKSLLDIGLLVSELDCLIGMAAAAREHNFTRPQLIQGNGDLEITDGRHPLVEAISGSTFVPNSTLFEGSERVVILTGPNASGKSIYLKQVGIIVLMALSGSFVPASSAVIPTFDRVCTRIHTKESVSGGMSTFLIDCSQMARALRTATKATLILADEFGKGTAEADGLGLLVATIQDFIEWDDNCPTIFISTHFYSIMSYLHVSPTIKLQTMEFIQETSSEIVFLYKLKNGICKSSFSHLTAARVGVSEEIIQRSLEIHEIVSNPLDNDHITPQPSALAGVSEAKKEAYLRIAREFMKLDLRDPSFDPVAYLDYVAQELGPFRPKLIPIPSPTACIIQPFSVPLINQSQNANNNGEQDDTSGSGMDVDMFRTPANNRSAPPDFDTVDTLNEPLTASPFGGSNFGGRTDRENDETDASTDNESDIFAAPPVDVFSKSGAESIGASLNVLFGDDNPEDPENLGPSVSEVGDGDVSYLDDVEDQEVSAYFSSNPFRSSGQTSTFPYSRNVFSGN